MSTLKADIELLNEATNLFTSAYDQCDGLSAEIEKIANEMDSIWDGAACNEYISRLREQAEVINDTRKVLNELKQYTANSSKALQEKDRRLREQLAFLERIGVLRVLDKIGVLDDFGIVKTGESSRTHGGGKKF